MEKKKVEKTTPLKEQTTVEYKRQGSIDDENFLYLAEKISNGGNTISEAIENINFDVSPIVNEMKSENLGEKIDSLANSISGESDDYTILQYRTATTTEELQSMLIEQMDTNDYYLRCYVLQGSDIFTNFLGSTVSLDAQAGVLIFLSVDKSVTSPQFLMFADAMHAYTGYVNSKAVVQSLYRVSTYTLVNDY